MAIDYERASFYYKFDLKLFDKRVDNTRVDYRRIVAGNKEGMTPAGREKVIDFFMQHPDSYRKLYSYIKMQQFMANKYIQISDKDICAFTGIKKDELMKVMFYLTRKMHFLKGNCNEYRIPEYIWNSDVLDVIKKKQLKYPTRKRITYFMLAKKKENNGR